MVDQSLLDILVCPESHQSLAPAEPVLLARLNESLATGGLSNRSGQVVTDPLEEALVREDRRVLYPVRDGIPIMLIDESIPLSEQV